MKKKLVIGCIGIVFMLMAITIVSAVETKTTENKVSPIFNRKLSKHMKEKISQNIQTNYIKRIFLLPFPSTNSIEMDFSLRNRLAFKCEFQGLTQSYGNTCITSLADLETCMIYTCPLTWS